MTKVVARDWFEAGWRIDVEMRRTRTKEERTRADDEGDNREGILCLPPLLVSFPCLLFYPYLLALALLVSLFPFLDLGCSEMSRSDSGSVYLSKVKKVKASNSVDS